MKFKLMLVVILLFLAACNSSEKEQVQTEETNERPDFPRTITDVKGQEIELAERPSKIALTYYPFVDNLLVLDEMPIATTSYNEYIVDNKALQPYLTTFKGRQIEDVGDWQTIHLGKLAKVAPDVILAGGETSEKVYEQLRQIAPVIFFDATKVSSDWKYGLQEVAKVVGKEERATEVIAGLDAIAADFKRQLEKLGNETVLFMAITDRGFAVRAREHLQYYYDELDLNTPENFEAGQMSLESLLEMNPDHIFVFDFQQNPVAPRLEKLREEQAWNHLKAVTENQVYIVDSALVYPNPISLQYGLTTIAEALE